ncbi:hypothetical protein D3C71_1289880 [compost metagenome]
MAITAPSTSINKMAGRATPAITWPVEGDASTNCEAINSAMEDIGVIAQPTQSACFQLAPLPTLPSATPVALATRRTAIRASTTPATGALQSACAATVETSTNISMVSSDDALPSCRGHAQGRGLSCLSSMPPSSAASGAEPPMWAATAVPAATSARNSMEVFSLVGLMKRSAMRSTRASTAATTMDTPSTTTTGYTVSINVTLWRLISSALALPNVKAYSVDRVVSTMARSVTGPAARVSATTRVRTAGEAARATRASGPATCVGRFSHTSTQYTAK